MVVEIHEIKPSGDVFARFGEFAHGFGEIGERLGIAVRSAT
jgi:hypothetical protein